jgi:hypothetical protein
MTNYTYNELLHLLDQTTNDPLVRKLLDMLYAGENGVVAGLIDQGMDPLECTFEEGYEYYSPGDYIKHLRSDRDYYKDEYDLVQTELEESQLQCRKLSARSVAELLHDMELQVRESNAAGVRLAREVNALTAKNGELTDKLNTWKIVEHDRPIKGYESPNPHD